jgi:hypothetical protein
MDNEIQNEITIYQQEASNKITNPDQLLNASILLSKVKTASKVISDKKAEIIKPAMESLAATRALFSPFETSLKDLEVLIKGNIKEYQLEEEARIKKETERLAARVEKGTMKMETATTKMANLGTVPTKSDLFSTRKVNKVRVIDESLLPREYLSPNMEKITFDILKNNISIPGAERWIETIIATK